MKPENIRQGFSRLKTAWDSMSGTYGRITERSRRWKALWEAGGGDVTACLEADFGPGGPSNLALKPFLNQTIEIRSFFKDPWFQNLSLPQKALELLTIAGRGGSDISLSPLSGSQSKTTTSAHEFVHTRQRHIWLAGWYGMAQHNTIEYLGQQEKHRLSRHWRKLMRGAVDTISYGRSSANVGNYFAENCEIQARMHEILAMGYQQWQKLPLNKTEFWAAMMNFGMTVPASVKKHMETAEGQKARVDFRVMESLRKTMAGTVHDLELVHVWAGDRDVQQALWNVQYPLLYGELLEMYGDIPGRARMGLGSNPRPSIEISSYLKNFSGRMPKEHAWDIARKIPNDQVIPLVNNLIHLASGLHDIKYNDFLMARRKNCLLVASYLLDRPGVRGAFLEPEQLSVHDYAGLDERPPLVSAIHHGDREMVKLLMNAGANPFQAYQTIDMRGKKVATQYPAEALSYIQIVQENLDNPERLPVKVRKFYTNPVERREIIENMNRQRDALLVMVHHGLRSEARYPVRKKGRTGRLTFTQALATLGMQHNFIDNPPFQPEGEELTI